MATFRLPNDLDAKRRWRSTTRTPPPPPLTVNPGSSSSPRRDLLPLNFPDPTYSDAAGGPAPVCLLPSRFHHLTAVAPHPAPPHLGLPHPPPPTEDRTDFLRFPVPDRPFVTRHGTNAFNDPPLPHNSHIPPAGTTDTARAGWRWDWTLTGMTRVV